jgi:hypothetical protein
MATQAEYAAVQAVIYGKVNEINSFYASMIPTQDYAMIAKVAVDALDAVRAKEKIHPAAGTS